MDSREEEQRTGPSCRQESVMSSSQCHCCQESVAEEGCCRRREEECSWHLQNPSEDIEMVVEQEQQNLDKLIPHFFKVFGHFTSASHVATIIVQVISVDRRRWRSQFYQII